MLCKPINPTKDKFLLFYLIFMLSLLPVLRDGGKYLVFPLGVTLCRPPSSVSMPSGDGDGQEGQDDFFALCPPTLIPRGRCLLGQ